MFYYIFTFIIVSLFLVYKERNSKSIRYSILTMCSYTLALFMFALYISKDSYYYNTINYLFSIPLPIWNRLMFFPVSLKPVIRLMNLFILSTLYFGTRFVFAICDLPDRQTRKYSRIFLALFALEWILYDPDLFGAAYLFFYPDCLDFRQFNRIKDGLHGLTVAANTGVILTGLLLLYRNYRKSSPVRIIKAYSAGIGICHALIMGSYLFVFGRYPICLVKISKTAGIMSYLTAPLITDKWLSALFPYYLICSFILICFSLYRAGRIETSLKNESFTLSKQISAADTTSKAFCHYVKNEVLAIQSEIEIIDATPEQAVFFREIIDRCEHLYLRLDILYRSSKASVLTLQETCVNDVLRELLSDFSGELRECRVQLRMPEETVGALLDRTYFFQALHNILSNALDAMDGMVGEKRLLAVSLDSINRWTTIQITDNGRGIPAAELPHIFTPFYTTHPLTNHWGIGLSLTYKIIEAHEGHITIDSVENRGTTVEILLPRI